MQRIERVIVLPTADNDGVSLAWEVKSIKAAILAIAGGFSEVRQSGVWEDDSGRVCRDDSWRVSITSDTATDTRIKELLPEWCERLRQVCLYTHTSRVNADFVYASKDKATA